MLRVGKRYAALEKAIGYRFKKQGLLETALTHRSYRYEVGDVAVDNERLEFLGDAVLGFLAAAHLYEVHEAEDEGVLTTLRSLITSRKALGRVGQDLSLGDFLRVGQGEERTGGRTRLSNLTNAVEAVLGAVYLDGGIKGARKMFDTVIAPLAEMVGDDPQRSNPKGQLQEYTQAQFRCTPVYEVTASTGPAHNMKFTVRVSVAGGRHADGTGNSKQAAEAAAARVLLEQLREA